MSILEKATCKCCDSVRQYIQDHFDPSGDGIRANSDAATVYAEIEEMFEGQDEGSGITVAHLEEYIAALETEVEVEVEVEGGEESTMTLVDTQVAEVEVEVAVEVEELMTTPITEESEDALSNIIDLSPTHAELIRASQFADMLIKEATATHGLKVVEDNAKVVVSIQSKHKKARCIAWFSDPMANQPYGWSNREGSEVYQEMNFTPEMLNREPNDILAVVIHEKVHKWCKALGEKDCALSGRHNKTFQKFAEYLGLVVAPATDSYGWGYTSPSPELVERIEKEFQPDVTKFNVYRLPVRKGGKASNKLQKWVCTSGKESDCGAMYSRGDYEAVYVCQRCGEPLQRAQPKGGDN